MKTYEVTRSTSGQIGVLVHHHENRIRNATLLKHCVLHSPDGFETGYSGSGPSDLAVSILADHFGVAPERIERVYKQSWGVSDNLAGKVFHLHHHFKAHFIAPRKLEKGESYQISGDDIAAWISDQQ
jgi:hypothetical protein